MTVNGASPTSPQPALAPLAARASRAPHASRAAAWAALRHDARRASAVALCAALLLGALGVQAAGLAPGAALTGLLGLCGLLALARARLAAHLPQRALGAANHVTLARAVVVSSLVGFVVAPYEDPAVAWTLVVVTVATLVLDGVDGRLARRGGTASAFGAWADQELDAFFVVVLSALVWRTGEAGPWILAAGAWRYVFLAAVALVPRLRGPLAPSFRRKLVCIVQLAALVACVSPLFEPPLSTAVAAASLALLSASFLIDVGALWRRGSSPATTP